MATYSKKILSSSVDGRAVVVAATSSTGTLIHTGSTNTSVLQEIWLYASNPDTLPHTLTVQWGSTSSPGDSITVYLEGQGGLVVLVPGLILKGNATPLEVRAYADTASKVTIHGYLNEIA